MFNRLGIRRKLALLLVIPLAAELGTLAPLIIARVHDARASLATAHAASAARDVGVLIQDLQQERLVALGYLSTPQLDRSALVSQGETGTDDAARLRGQPGTAAILRRAEAPLAALDAFRAQVLNRAIDPTSVYRAYRQADAALLDALDLVDTAQLTAADQRQLEALDELMRANEEASSAGAALVALAGDTHVDLSLLTDALAAQEQHTGRFRDLVTAGQVTLLDEVEAGRAGQRIQHLVDLAGQGAVPGSVSDALTAALSYTGLRRIAQDRIARQIADAADHRATVAEATVLAVAGGAALLLLLAGWLGIVVSRSIAVPLRRLTAAATAVADLAGAELLRIADSEDTQQAARRLAAVDIPAGTEIGTLAGAFNRVQATAAQLLERQLSARRNTSVMFANIARRTQNLVGRQLVALHALHMDRHDPATAESLRRLDLLTTRLRRSADSLLVVSGTIDQGIGGAPTLLAEVLRAALAEIEGFDAVAVGELADVAVTAGLATDLRLLLAELLENATNFSPPGSPVRLGAQLSGDCVITIADQGLGLTPQRLHEENERLVERERLDVAPTRMLGLFVVGRLARRHGLRVRLNHSQPSGVTAIVGIPAHLLAPAGAAGSAARPGPALPVPAAKPPVAGVLDLTPVAGPFDWFGPTAQLPALPAPAPAPAPTQRPVPVQRAAPAEEPAANHPAANHNGLRRRVPGAHLPEIPRTDPQPVRTPGRDPAAERAAATAFTHPAPAPETRPSGLTRRVPGQHLRGAARPNRGAHTNTERNPSAERAAIDGLVAGFARGAGEAYEQQPPPTERS